MLQTFVESMHKAVQANKLVENAVPIAKQGLKNAHAILKKMKQRREPGLCSLLYFFFIMY